ncbi:uncharacterized protein K441DRAFT_545617, partial [Cenococcum geophilum 1.58]
QYLTLEEEKALISFLLLISNLRQPIQINLRIRTGLKPLRNAILNLKRGE